MANLQSNAQFCKECVRSDEEKIGYSYWRRSHQIPGIHRCANHDKHPLSQVGAKSAFLELPGSWIRNEIALDEKALSVNIEQRNSIRIDMTEVCEQ
jgi:hypothetical protein